MACDRRERKEGMPCVHYIRSNVPGEAGLCLLPDQFRCTEAIDTLSVKLSDSVIQDFMKCKQLWYYRHIVGIDAKPEYVSQATKRQEYWLKLICSLFVNPCADALVTVEPPIAITPVNVAIVRGVFRAFVDMIDTKIYLSPSCSLTCECLYRHHDSFAGDVIIAGNYDRLYQNHFVLTKFTHNPSVYTKLPEIESLVGTSFLANNAMEYIDIETVAYPDIRPYDKQWLKGEVDVSVIEDKVYGLAVCDPRKVFVGYNYDTRCFGTRFYRAEFDLEEIRRRYIIIMQEIRETAKRESWYKCDYACRVDGGCDYFPICETGGLVENKFTYRKSQETGQCTTG